jgi:hypothetical protein
LDSGTLRVGVWMLFGFCLSVTVEHSPWSVELSWFSCSFCQRKLYPLQRCAVAVGQVRVQETIRHLLLQRIARHFYSCIKHVYFALLLKSVPSPVREIWKPTATTKSYAFLGAFAKLRKATITFACLSVRPHGAARLPVDEFSWNFDIWVFFENLPWKLKFHWNFARIRGTLHEDIFAFITICRWIFLRMGNVSDRFVENIKAHFNVH